MTSLGHDGRSPQECLAFFRAHRDRLGRITHAAVTVPASTSELFYTMVLRDCTGGQLLLSGLMGDEDVARAVLVRIALEAGFAEESAEAIRSHGAVRMRRGPDGATCLESASGPRWRFPRRLPTEPARAALRRFALDHAVRLGDLAGVLSVEAALVNTVMTSRWLQWEAADRLAVALRSHPQELWPGWFGQHPINGSAAGGAGAASGVSV